MMLRLLSSRIRSRSSSSGNPFLFLKCLSSSQTETPDLQPSFMVGYLINSFGFPSDKAARLVKRIDHVKSPEKPDSVIGFLKSWGFDDTHIRQLVSNYPPMLCCNVDKTIDPNVKTLLQLGFKRSDLPKMVISNPPLLTHSNIGPRIQFWRSLLGNDDNKLRRVLEGNRGILSLDHTLNITHKLSLLRTHGLSDQQIQKLIVRGNVFLVTSLQSLLDWTVELGLRVNSTMFLYCLDALARNNRANFEAKMGVLMDYGWSEQDFLHAFKKYPGFTVLSQKNIQAKMEFLVGTAGCTPSDISRRPSIVRCSMEKRLVPRNHVLQVLKAKKVANLNYYSVADYTDKMFLDKCVKKFEPEVPGLQKIYDDACAGRLMFPSGRSLGLEE